MSANLSPAQVIWITGLSQSGKTTLADGLADWLRTEGARVQVLDGRTIRDDVGDYFGYSREERIKVSRLLTVVARLLSENGVTVVVTSITPYEESREHSRKTLARYFEIYLHCPAATCAARDTSGLWEKAQRGDVRHFIGVDDPFEVPRSYDLKIDTGALSAAESATQARASLGTLLQR